MLSTESLEVAGSLERKASADNRLVVSLEVDGAKVTLAQNALDM